MWKVILPVEYKDRIIAEAGGPRKVGRWLQRLIDTYFAAPDPASEIVALRQEVNRLQGEVRGLNRALEYAIRPRAGTYLLNEGLANDQQYNPYPPVNGDGSSIPSTR